MNRIAFLRCALALACTAAVTVPTLAQAQAATDYPTKGLRVIVPFPPGGASDALGRMVAQHLSNAWGQPAVVEDRPGAGGNIGAEAGAKAAPDGYTLTLAAAGFMAVNPSVYPKLGYDSAIDFQPVALLVNAPLLLVVNPKIPAQNAREFIELAKRDPGKLTVGNGGTGTAQHLGGVSFALAAGVDVQHIPYKGSAPATTDLLGGVTDAQFDNLVTLVPFVKSGKLRALGVSSTKRVAALPDVPALGEMALPGFETGTWYGIVVPKNTPKAVVDKINAALLAMLAQPDVKEKLLGMGLEPEGGTPAQFGALIRSEIAKYATIVKSANIKAE
ncbi:Bug family tripartite tricarboxylate transporter substrate binding protein [Variovorax paradoxus]|uniref:Bug family tripartite tricarboxylate transporter substrate binding protein n=1 Tax=Variovorax paradoxus TaxID=34073 RepID=UPI0027896698|nr:tripartite tricarboxylate transporter substrate binding protein [Variovorax paradoxus]MDQ0588298.1 tripartite-type tricarboxylate transporter receptor subunit TctC [Variovorax paradoxus]